MQPRKALSKLVKRMKEPRKYIQVLLGPRQVGKTTLANQLEKEMNVPSLYISADTATLEDLAWLETHWELARQICEDEALLIIDEVQKIPKWSSLVKKLWDLDTRNNVNLKVVILGSSPWLMQKGLSESLAGRFEILPITHWNYEEMKKSFGFSLEEFIFYGGYPGPAPFVHDNEFNRWLNYINDSLIETTISRDILLMTQVNKPILLRRLFQLGCMHSSQILSYQKMLGRLHDAGNTTTLAHYLELLSGAGVLTRIYKYTNREIREKSSSPKLQVLNTALMAAQHTKTLEEALDDKEFWGRMVESAIGAYLLNSARGTQIKIYYWREKNQEVDFILKKGDYITAIEVKSSLKKEKLSGLNAFAKAFNPSKILVVGPQGISYETFLSSPIEKWVS